MGRPMSVDAVARFQAALAEIAVDVRLTTAAEFPTALEAVVVEPAVATPLRIDGLTLDGTAVTVDPTPDELRSAETGVTAGCLAIADYGTVGIESHPDGDELVSLYPRRQVVVVPESRIHPTMDAAFDWLTPAVAGGLDSLVFVTGSSATADMGATVDGVRGPGEVHVLVVEDR